jgi:MHS family proline/betaine transporter-like MFS transporter
MLQGLSASAEIPGAQVLILEHARSSRRGRAVALNNAAGNLGTACAASVALILAKLLSPDQLATWGWRVAFLIAAPIGIVGWYVRTRALESPEFSRLDRASRPATVPLMLALRTAKRGMITVAVWMAAVLLAGYLLGGFLPSYLIRVAGLSPDGAFTATLSTVMLSTATMLAAGYLVDRYPLRLVAIGVMAGLAAMAVPGFLIATSYRTLGFAILGQGMWAVFIGAAYTVGAVLSVTLFPAAIRFTATAVALNLGATLFAGTAPYIATWLVAATGSPTSVAVYLLIAASGGLLVAILGLPHRLTLQEATTTHRP